MIKFNNWISIGFFQSSIWHITRLCFFNSILLVNVFIRVHLFSMLNVLKLVLALFALCLYSCVKIYLK